MWIMQQHANWYMSVLVDTRKVFHVRYIFTQNGCSSVSLQGCKNNESSGFLFPVSGTLCTVVKIGEEDLRFLSATEKIHCPSCIVMVELSS